MLWQEPEREWIYPCPEGEVVVRLQDVCKFTLSPLRIKKKGYKVILSFEWGYKNTKLEENIKVDEKENN
ncbi:MAG: hypothetical protein V3T73_02515 [Dehalococcoidales bacterium]